MTQPSAWTDPSIVPAPARITRLTFHPKFAITTYPLEDDHVILRSTDETCFFTSKKLLSAHSTFFSDLFAAAPPPLYTARESDPELVDTLSAIIDPPSGTSAAIRIFIYLISHPSRKSHKLAQLFTTAEPDTFLAELEQTIVFAAAIEAPQIPAVLAKQFDHMPFVLYALAGVANDEHLALIASGQIAQVPHTIVPFVARRLLENCPRYRDRLSQMREARLDDWDKMEMGLKGGTTMCDGVSGFTKNCKAGGGCVAFRNFRGDFREMRHTIAGCLIEILRTDPSVADDEIVSTGVDQYVHCQACAYRLKTTFDDVVWHYRHYGTQSI